MTEFVPASARLLPPSTGVGLVIHDWGGDGPPVLLAHATGFHGLVWRPVARRLVAAGRHVWSFDFRGHGDSDPSPDGTYAWSGFAADARAVADHLGLTGEPTLTAAGHSKGGASLLLGEADAPHTYARLWCFEPVVFPSTGAALPPDNPLSARARRRHDVWPSRAAAFDSYASRPPLNVFTEDALHAYVDYGFRNRADSAVELKCRPETEAAVYAMGAAHGTFERLADVHAPTVIASGTRDLDGPAAVAPLLVERLPRGRLEIFDGLGHFGPQEDPDAVAASILRFADSTR